MPPTDCSITPKAPPPRVVAPYARTLWDAARAEGVPQVLGREAPGEEDMPVSDYLALLQRRLGLPDASVMVLQGIAFVLILASEALRDVDWKAFWAKVAKGAGPSGAQVSMGDKIA